ncbi:hypothetical protein BHM03_00044589 [Ensete ventricosum]|nr:hypothetical protein BHM03_00044589 [Ensete ventricosum]
MGRKLGFTYLFSRMRDAKHASSSLPSPPPLPWTSCRHPRTRSFREEDGEAEHDGMSACSFDLNVSCSESISTAWEDPSSDAAEAVIRGLRSDRLFFEPEGATRSIVAEEEAAEADSIPFEGSIAMAVDSEDPYRDFKQSMEEMVMAHGVKVDWAWLEEMLAWYLRVNGKKTHEIIIEAFLDLLLSLAPSPSSSSSSCSSCTFGIEEEESVLSDIPCSCYSHCVPVANQRRYA